MSRRFSLFFKVGFGPIKRLFAFTTDKPRPFFFPGCRFPSGVLGLAGKRTPSRNASVSNRGEIGAAIKGITTHLACKFLAPSLPRLSHPFYFHVFSVADKLEVFRAVVVLNAVDVVDILFGEEQAAYNLLHD